MLINTAAVKGIYLLIVVWLLVACGSSAPPTSSPTPTPIPGFVGGEEPEAYASFIEYYHTEINDCYDDPHFDNNFVYFISDKSPGRGVYVGDGIWRFHIQVGVEDVSDRIDDATYSEKLVEIRSRSDRTWDNVCNPYDPRQEDYEPDYYQEEPEEPPDQDWP